MPTHDPSTGTTHRSPQPADQLVASFEAHRTHLRAVAYRMLGSLADAEDAVQEAWLRYSRAETGQVDNLGGWLTRVVGRVCLDVLRSRRSRREREAAAAVPVAGPPPGSGAGLGDGEGAVHDPEQEALMADDVGLALLVVLDRLAPVERVAFVLHDLFAVPFADIAPIVERSEATTKRLASRARHRVRGGDATALSSGASASTASLVQQRALVDAFLVATRRGDIEALLTLLAPDVVRRADLAALAPGKPIELRGARPVAEETAGNAARARFAAVALVDGSVGLVVAPAGHLVLALRLAIDDHGRVAEIDTIADPARLAALDLAVLPS